MPELTTVPRPADRADWLTLRGRWWNASDAAALLHRHPFVHLAEAVGRKLGQTPPEPENEAMRRGRHLEAAVASWWEERHGIALLEPEVLYVCDDVLAATLDRLPVGNDDTVVEIKTIGHVVDEPERYWLDQLQVQLLCSGRTGGLLLWLDPSMTLKEAEVLADVELQAELLERATKVMDAVRRGEWPPDVTPPYRMVAAEHPRHTSATVDLDDLQAHACEELAAVRAQRRHLDDTEEELKALIAAALGDAGIGLHDGRQVVTWRSQTRRTVDVTALRSAEPEVAERYTVATSARIMRVMP